MSVGYPEKKLQNVQVMSYEGKDFNPARLVPPRNQGQDLRFTYFRGLGDRPVFSEKKSITFIRLIQGFRKTLWMNPCPGAITLTERE